MPLPRPQTPREVLAFERIPQYNIGAWNAQTNPYGFDEDGHQYNQMPQAQDVGVIGLYARDMALLAEEGAIEVSEAMPEIREAREEVAAYRDQVAQAAADAAAAAELVDAYAIAQSIAAAKRYGFDLDLHYGS